MNGWAAHPCFLRRNLWQIARLEESRPTRKARRRILPPCWRRTETQNNKSGIIMTTLEIKGDWNITKGKLKQKWAKLTDDDLQYSEGQQEELVGRIQKRTGETREAVEKAVHELCSSCGCN